MKKTLLTLALAAASLVGVQAQTLSIGDFSIIGYRADADDAIAFVSWIDLNAGTSLFFTDSGFFDDGTMRDSENNMSWISPSGGILAGTVIVITSPATSSANIGATTGALSGLAAGGDQVFIGQSAFPSSNDTSKPGSAYTASNLLFGFDMNGGAGWDSDATSSGTSALPSALNVTGGNLSVAHFDNGQYTGVRTGLTIAQYKTAVADVSNWTFNDDGPTFGALSATAFTPIPEPSTYALAILGALIAIIFARRRRANV